MVKPLLPPPFEIPFDDQQLILMGKIAVLWGHIDEAFNTSLRWALRMDQQVFEELFDGQMIGSKLAVFRQAGERLASAHAKSLFEMVGAQLTVIIPQRNAAMDHCWGRFGLDSSDANTRVGTYSHQKPKKRFYVEQLPKLYDDMAAALQFLANIRLFMVDEKPEFTTFKQNKIHFAPSLETRGQTPSDSNEATEYFTSSPLQRAGRKTPADSPFALAGRIITRPFIEHAFREIE